MYQPDHFRVEDVVQMHALMRARPFAALVSRGSLGLYASHLPTVLKDEGPYGLIECHLARANPHWKDLAAGTEALMIFQGPEGYITPNWYASKTVHGKVVPTWNYAVVHARIAFLCARLYSFIALHIWRDHVLRTFGLTLLLARTVSHWLVPR